MSVKSKTNIQKITELTNKWYAYVNLDHHKSRDCVWNIEISYAYGEKPKYMAYHNGYVIERWNSPECDTLEDAEQWVINKLERELHTAKIHLQEIIALDRNEEAQWMDPANRAPEILKELMK
jgi:hypothetical protein